MKIVAIIQARLGSSRFPQKVFANLCGKPLIEHIVDRLKFSDKITNIVLATTNNIIDNKLVYWAKNKNINIARGSENNVLERFYFAAKQYNADIIVRITADDPFKDPIIIDSVVDKLINERLDFAYNNNPPTFPEGLDVEVFTFDALKNAFLSSTDDFEKEHVTQYFYKNINSFKHANISNDVNLSNLRWTIDTKIDYEMVKLVYKYLYKENEIFLKNDILSLLDEKPEIALINSKVKRSTMYK